MSYKYTVVKVADLKGGEDTAKFNMNWSREDLEEGLDEWRASYEFSPFDPADPPGCRFAILREVVGD